MKIVSPGAVLLRADRRTCMTKLNVAVRDFANAHKNINMYCIWIFNPYRAVNTLRLGYKNQSVSIVHANERYLLLEAFKHINTLSGQKAELFLLNLMLHIVT
jgi:hypothetical protein